MSEDRLLKIDEAAERLSTSVDWLYHHWATLPFAVKLSKRQRRFSLQGIESYIRTMQNSDRKEELHARKSISAGVRRITSPSATKAPNTARAR